MGNKGFLKFLGVALVTSALAACGGGGASYGSGGTTGSTTGGTTGTDTPIPASIKLIASAPQLPSAASTTTATGAITLTAIVKDSSNNLLAGVPVIFSSTKASGTLCGGGGAVTPGGTTDATGTAKSILTTSGDQSNQIITVKVKVGSLSDSIDIPVIGTNLQATGPASVGAGSTVTYKFSLLDSAGNGIGNQTVTISSCKYDATCAAPTAANSLSSTTINTDPSGKGQVTYTGNAGGSDTLVFSAGCASPAMIPVQISSQNLVFITPNPNSATTVQVPLDTAQKIVVNLKQGTAPVVGQAINFISTRGTFEADAASLSFVAATASAPASVVTDASGNATIALRQVSGPNRVGSALITATVASGSAISATAKLEIVASTPTKINLQAQPSTVPINATSVISAVVRDANDNPVASKTVNFVLSGVGGLSATSAVTDTQGTATVTYSAPATSTGTRGVTVTGTVNGTAIAGSVNLTVGAKALNITLGTGNSITPLDLTRYQFPYSVTVTDSAGNPAANAIVNLSVNSVAYQKGVEVFTSGSWSPVYSIPTSSQSFGCGNEDVDLNGVLNVGEDTNSNGILEPGAVASVPVSVTLDAAGGSQFFITYPKDHAYWVQVKLTATVSVAGSEGTKSVTFVLPGAVGDYSNAGATPPGQASPYGTVNSCSVDDTAPIASFALGAADTVDPSNSSILQSALALATPTTAIPVDIQLNKAAANGGSAVSVNVSLSTSSANGIAPSPSTIVTFPADGTTTVQTVTVTPQGAGLHAGDTVTLTLGTATNGSTGPYLKKIITIQ